ncbi:hypothetical protein DEQ92_14195 [Haloferax sp. Atlit-6N]|uniref:TrmB family transcriptional regulator n=1 Tax=Haloferax sp. Atlit-6N TaxID=2077205 RepID=UPI000E283A95|nr:helix-turn-helix domain-containing protein [Haloferax sp. Atlit-6N]REA02051.1 hypothetical protein DEQ92_14195 [Haloferax sp. Atlit-6N]
MTANPSDVTASLEWFGLSSYEAQIIVALQKLGLGTAKEIAEVTAVPQSQVYGAAGSLEKRGLIEVERSNPKRYRSIEVEQVLDHLETEYYQHRADVAEGLKMIREQFKDERSESQEHVWTVTGSAAVLSRITTLLNDATDSLIIGLESASPIADDIVNQLHGLDNGTIDITVITTDESISDSVREIATVYQPPLDPELEASSAMSGHVLVVDDTAILVSACTSDSEIAIWSAETEFANVLIDMSKARLETFFPGLT